MTTDLSEPITQVGLAEKPNYQDHYRLGEKGRPELTPAGRDFADGLYYGQVFGAADPHDKVHEILEQQKTEAPRQEYFLLRKRLESKLKDIDAERTLITELHEGRSVWNEAYEAAIQTTGPDKAVAEGRFAKSVISARREIGKEVQKQVKGGVIPETVVSTNKLLREFNTARETTRLLKEKAPDDNRTTPEIVQSAVEEMNKLRPITAEQVNAITADTITKPKEKTGREMVKEWVDNAVRKIPAPVRRTVLITTLAATLAVGLSGSVPQPSERGTVGVKSEAVMVAQPQSFESAKTKKESPVKIEKAKERKSVVYTGPAKSEYGGSYNTAGTENGGVVKMGPTAADTFIADGIDAASKDAKVYENNRTLAQITKDVGPEGIGGPRGTDSAFGNGESGLHFTKDNYYSNDLAGLTNPDKPQLKLDNKDGLLRGVGVVDLKDIGTGTQAFVDAALRAQGKDPNDPGVQKERQDMYQKALADMSVVFNKDGSITINEVHMSAPDEKGHQDENLVTGVNVSDVEKPGDAVEQENSKNVDKKNTVMLTVVFDKVKNIFRIEAYDASATTDSLNPKMGETVQTQDVKESWFQKVRAGLKRLVPTGKGENVKAEAGSMDEVPQETITEIIDTLPPEIHEIVVVDNPTDSQVDTLVQYYKNNRGKGNNLWKGYDLNNPSLLKALFGKLTKEQKQQFLWAPDSQEVKPSIPGKPIIKPSSTYTQQQVNTAVSNLPNPTIQVPAGGAGPVGGGGGGGQGGGGGSVTNPNAHGGNPNAAGGNPNSNKP